MSKNTLIKDRIAVLAEETGKSGNVLGQEAGLANGTVDTWNEKPIDFSTDKVDKFLNHHRISKEWWKTGNGDIFLPKAQMARINGFEKETFYKNLIEDNEDYSLIPRAVLRDYKIVPDKIIDVILESNKNEKNAIAKSFEDEKDSLINRHELIITGLKNKIKDLETEKEILKRQITTKSK